MSTRATLRGNFTLELLPRDALIRMVDELDPRGPVSPFTRSYMRGLLVQLIDQMEPKRDTRVNVRAWQIAMLAAALVDERNVQAKRALLAAIETFAPEKAQDAKFRAFIERTYSRLREGKNPARSLLLPVHADVLKLAVERLQKG